MGFRPEGSFHAKQVSSCQASRQAGHHRMREPLTHKNSLIDFQMADRPQSPHTALRFLNSFVVAEGSKCECVRIVHNYLMLIVYHTVLEVQINVFIVSIAVYIYIYILYWILTLKQLLSFIRTDFSCYYLYVVQQQHIWSHPKMLINRTFKIKVGKNSLSMRKNIGIILDGTHAKQNKWEGLNLPILALKWDALKAYSIFPCRAFGYGVKHPSTLNVAPFFLSVLLSFFLSFYAWPFFNPILDLFWSPKVAKDQGEEIAQDLEKVGEKEREKHVKIGKQRSSFFFLFILFLCLLPLFHSVAISSFLFVLLFIFWWFQEVLVTERYGTICSTGTWYCNMFL